MANVADDIAAYLAAQGRGTVGTDIFRNSMPPSVEKKACIGVYETGGFEPDMYLPTAEPTIQVRVRKTKRSTLKTLVANVVDDLHQKANAELVSGETYFYYILLMGEPIYFAPDNKGIVEATINFRMKIRR